MESWERDSLNFHSFFGDTVVGCELLFSPSTSSLVQTFLSLRELLTEAWNFIVYFASTGSCKWMGWRVEKKVVTGATSLRGPLLSTRPPVAFPCAPVTPLAEFCQLPISCCKPFSLLILILQLLVYQCRERGIKREDLPMILHTYTHALPRNSLNSFVTVSCLPWDYL